MTWWQSTWGVVVQTYVAVWRNLGALALGMLPAVGIFVGARSLLERVGPDSAAQENQGMYLALAILAMLIGQFFVIMLLVGLYRRLLLKTEAKESLLRLVPNRRDWKCLGMAITLVLALGVGYYLSRYLVSASAVWLGGLLDGIAIAVEDVEWMGISSEMFVGLVYLLPYLPPLALATYLLSRIALVFPAIATEVPEPISSAWNTSKGTVWMCWLGLLSVLVVFLALRGVQHEIAAGLSPYFPAPINKLASSLWHAFSPIALQVLGASLIAAIFALKASHQTASPETHSQD